MKIKAITTEDFVNYRRPSMFIASAVCDWKCCRESGGRDICQNTSLAESETTEISDEAILSAFVMNDITEAVVIGGLEPMLQADEVTGLLRLFRSRGENCPFVIYTGYNREEIEDELAKISAYENVIVKFGRFLPDRPHKFDPLLGVELSSDNQYAEKIS